jgi:hypothetical protein
MDVIPVSTASCCQLPASRPAPDVHARKRGGQIEKTHNTEGLGSENISMFFSNSIANKKGFLPRPARFRAWVQGTGREAGSSQTDTGRNATGAIDTATFMENIYGVLYATPIGNSVSGVGVDDQKDCLNIDLARVWGEHAGTEFAPIHIRIPVVLYLGNSA